MSWPYHSIVTVPRNGADSSTRERAYEYIQSKIMDGELPAGSAVSDFVIARECGFSRTPVREAISQLATEGFLEQMPNRGAIVVQPRRTDITDLFELREALEVYAIRKTAHGGLSKGDSARIAQVIDLPLRLIEELRASGHSALDASQMRRFIAADLAFHTVLLHSAGNLRILKVVKDTRLLIHIFAIRHAGHTAKELTAIHRQHTGILKEVTRGCAEKAALTLSEHIQKSMQERLDAFDEFERERSLGAMAPASKSR